MRESETVKGDIAIYRSPQKGVEVRVRLQEGTVWLSLNQITVLFDTDKSGISRHINNIYRTGELKQQSTVAKIATVQTEGNRRVKRNIEYFNLDMIISVGYRVNSKRATQFRIWATNILKQHILHGYTLNESRLLEAKEKFDELQKAIAFVQKKVSRKELVGQEKEILSLLSDYAKTLRIIEQHDAGNLKTPKGKKARYVISYDDSQKIIADIKRDLILKQEASDLFGREVGRNFEGIVRNLYQTFDGKELYPTLEFKAAHLLYLTIKDHPFVDGNKRIGSFLFVCFLYRNRALHKKTDEPKINDNALTALAFLIATSNPKEKDILIKIILNLLAD